MLRKYLSGLDGGAQHARDLERINRTACKHNQEAAEVLEYQASEQ
jgi:hypothetical protein